MTEAHGELYDIGYQRYQGPREGRWRSRMAVFENGVRTLLGIGRGGKAKILPALLFIAAILPALVMVIVLSVVGDMVDLPGPADYYGVVSQVLIIFGAIMAPELLIPDRRERVLHLYLVRPLSVTDYLAARVAAFFVIVLALVYSGQIFLQIGLLLSATDPVDYMRDNWLDIPRFLASGFLLAIFVTVIPMAVSGFIARRAFATAFVIGLWFISASVVGGLSAQECTFDEGPGPRGPIQQQPECEYLIGDNVRWVRLLELGTVPLHLNDMIFDEASEPDSPGSPVETPALPAVVPIAWYTLFVVGPGLLLWLRYRRIRI